MRALYLLLCLPLFGCATTTDVTAVPLRVGISKIKITPAEPVMLAGYGSRNKLSDGVAADLHARAFAIEDGSSVTVIVTADIIAFGPILSRSIKTEAQRRFGLPEERILLVGSHTPTGPAIPGPPPADHPEQVRGPHPYPE